MLGSSVAPSLKTSAKSLAVAAAAVVAVAVVVVAAVVVAAVAAGGVAGEGSEAVGERDNLCARFCCVLTRVTG